MNQKNYKKPYKPSFVNDSIRRIDRKMENQKTNKPFKTMEELLNSFTKKIGLDKIKTQKTVFFMNGTMTTRVKDTYMGVFEDTGYDYLFTLLVKMNNATSFKIVFGKSNQTTEAMYKYALYINNAFVISRHSGGRQHSPINTLITKTLLAYLDRNEKYYEVPILVQKDINACIRERNMGMAHSQSEYMGDKFYFRKKDVFSHIVTPDCVRSIANYAKPLINIETPLSISGISMKMVVEKESDGGILITFDSNNKPVVVMVNEFDFSINLGYTHSDGVVKLSPMGDIAFLAPHLLDVLSYINYTTLGKEIDLSQIETSIKYIHNMITNK